MPTDSQAKSISSWEKLIAEFVAIRSHEQPSLPLDDLNIFFVLNPKESQQVALLAWLLDPNGTHGAGVAFLKDFLDSCVRLQELPSQLDLNRASIRRELLHQLDGREVRPDIVISIGKLVIVLEAKFYAVERQLQLVDYARVLVEQYGEGSVDQRVLLYLTLSGREPNSVAALEEGRAFRFVEVSMEHVAANLLHTVRRQQRTNVYLERLLTDFLDYIGTHYRVQTYG